MLLLLLLRNNADLQSPEVALRPIVKRLDHRGRLGSGSDGYLFAELTWSLQARESLGAALWPLSIILLVLLVTVVVLVVIVLVVILVIIVVCFQVSVAAKLGFAAAVRSAKGKTH